MDFVENHAPFETKKRLTALAEGNKIAADKFTSHPYHISIS